MLFVIRNTSLLLASAELAFWYRTVQRKINYKSADATVTDPY